VGRFNDTVVPSCTVNKQIKITSIKKRATLHSLCVCVCVFQSSVGIILHRRSCACPYTSFSFQYLRFCFTFPCQAAWPLITELSVAVTLRIVFVTSPLRIPAGTLVVLTFVMVFLSLLRQMVCVSHFYSTLNNLDRASCSSYNDIKLYLAFPHFESRVVILSWFFSWSPWWYLTSTSS
jgi:hypothetical protein